VSACFAYCVNLGKPNNDYVATIKKGALPPPPGSILNLTKYSYVDKTAMLAKIMTGGDADIGNSIFFLFFIIIVYTNPFLLPTKVLTFSLQVCGESVNLSL
jgi:hypothetical protein